MVWDTNFDLIQGRGTPNCLAIYYLVCFCQSSHVGGLPSQIRNYSPYRKNSLQCTISGLRPPRLTLTVFGPSRWPYCMHWVPHIIRFRLSKTEYR
jgi:hypothetical protein